MTPGDTKSTPTALRTTETSTPRPALPGDWRVELDLTDFSGPLDLQLQSQ